MAERTLSGARCRNPRSLSSGWTQLPRAKIAGIGLVPSYLSSSATQMRELFSPSLRCFSPPPFFLVRSFWFFFGNVLSFSSPTTSGRSFLEQGSEESVFFPTQFLFFRDATTLVSEHSLCLFPWRFWFLSLFYFVHFGFNETNET